MSHFYASVDGAPTLTLPLTVRERDALIEAADRRRRSWRHVMTCTRPRCETCARADLGDNR